ncbi:MAG: insulinase family protein [Acidobacteria bacterium]|nr:insulinase family protein [Acidobacteriota bacterium]
MRKIFILLMLTILGAAASAQTRVPPLNIKERKLSNGLNVVSVRDTSNPVVTVQVWYRVGGKDDPPGKSGFAHMFEHMMFKATKNMPNETMDRLTEDVGGWNNAFTAEDVTAYHEVIPSNYLETLLWAESDRMVNLSVDEKNFSSERDVVKEEYRQGVEANPYGKLFWYLDDLSFTTHPYKRGVIGNLDELSAASLEDAFKFYREYYRPDNASLIVVGDFDQAQLDAWVDKYFNRIKNPGGEIKRVTVVEPPRTEEVRFEKERPNVPFPAIGITYFAPPSTSEDVPALDVAATILSDGRSSRLYQELVYKQQIAQEASFFTDIRADRGLLTFYAIAAGGKTLASIEKAFSAEIKKLQDEGPTAKELEKAKNKLVMDILRDRETASGKAQAIGRAIIYQNNANAVNTDVDQLQAVTAKDVMSVLRKYMQENTRAVIYYKQGEEKGGKE